MEIKRRLKLKKLCVGFSTEPYVRARGPKLPLSLFGTLILKMAPQPIGAKDTRAKAEACGFLSLDATKNAPGVRTPGAKTKDNQPPLPPESSGGSRDWARWRISDRRLKRSVSGD